jgi:hypothetical protein
MRRQYPEARIQNPESFEKRGVRRQEKPVGSRE